MKSRFSRLIAVVAAVFMSFSFSACATLGGGGSNDNLPSEQELVEAECDSEDREVADKGAIYVMGENNSFGKSVDVYLVGSNGTEDLIESNVAVGQQFGPERAYGLGDSGTLYIGLEHVGRKTLLDHQPAMSDVGRATLIVVDVSSSGNTPFSYSTVESHPIRCLP